MVAERRCVKLKEFLFKFYAFVPLDLIPRRNSRGAPSSSRRSISGVPNSLIDMTGAPEHSKGFSIRPSPILERANHLVLQSGYDFEPQTLDPYTQPCTHDPCDFAVTTEFMLINIHHSKGRMGVQVGRKEHFPRREIMLDIDNWPLATTDILWTPTNLIGMLHDGGLLPLKTWTLPIISREVYFHIKI